MSAPEYFIRRGLAYYIYWDGEAGVDRPAADVEKEMTKEALEDCYFEVRMMRNPTKKELEDELDTMGKSDSIKNHDALWIIAVSLRTTDDQLIGKNNELLSPRKIVENFVRNKYENLDGKPKLFLFQAGFPLGPDEEPNPSNSEKHLKESFIVGQDMFITNSCLMGPKEKRHDRYRYLEHLVVSMGMGSDYASVYHRVNMKVDQEYTYYHDKIWRPRLPELISTMRKDVCLVVKPNYRQRSPENLARTADPTHKPNGEKIDKHLEMGAICPFYCSIFNYYSYTIEEGGNRQGSRKDVENIKKTMLSKNIMVLESEEDLPLNILKEKLRAVFHRGDPGATNITFLMAHGLGNTMFLPGGEEFPLAELDDLLADNGVENIVIIEMCRYVPEETSIPESSRTEVAQLHTTESETFPITKRGVVIYWSTYFGDLSYRHAEDGSFFIQDLCKSFTQLPMTQGLYNVVEICTLTNDYMKQRECPRRMVTKMIPILNMTLTNPDDLLTYPPDSEGEPM